MGKKKHGTSGNSSGGVNHPGGQQQRNRNKKKNTKKMYEKETTINDNTSSTMETKNYYTKIIKQLQQQSDIAIRHSTLAALLHTSFNISSNNTNYNTTTTTTNTIGNDDAVAVMKNQQHQKQNIPRTLLQVIRDQITSIAIPTTTISATTAVVTKNSKQQMKYIKEQLHCSLLATECLSNYIVLLNSNNNNNNSSNEIDTEWISGWIVIFLQRIQEYIQYYHQQHEHEQQQQLISNTNDIANATTIPSSSVATTTTTTPSTTTIQILYIQFIEQCIIGIINLLEYIPSSMQRLYTYQQRCLLNNTKNKNNKNNNTMMDLHEMLYHLLLQIPNQQQQQQIHHVKEAYESLQYNIIQCLHIVWDDHNIDMILPLLEHNTNLYYKIQQILYTIIIITKKTNDHSNQQQQQQLNDSNDNDDNSTIQQLIHTNTIKLHCIGAIMSVYNSIVIDGLETISNSIIIDRDILSTCIQFVQSTISIQSSTISSKDNNNNNQQVNHHTLLYYLQNIVIQRLIHIYKIYYNELNDTQLEKQILHQQMYKQESARSIARRLMNHKNHHKTNNKNQDIYPDVDNNCHHVLSNEEMTTSTTATTATTPQKNPTKVSSSWEEVQVEWYTTIRPIQLSLELLINWTSSSSSISSQNQNDITDSNRMDVDDNHDNGNHNLNNNVLIDELRTCDIYNTVYELYMFLLHWYQQILNGSTTSTTSIINCKQNESFVPNIMIQNTILDLLSKTIVIIGHCYMNHIMIATPRTISTTTPTSSDSWIQLWNDLKTLLVMPHRFNHGSNSDTSKIEMIEPIITSNCDTKATIDIGQDDQMITVDGDSKNITVITNDNVMEDITTVSEIGNDGMIISTTNETLNHTTTNSNHENYESIIRLQESITGTMVTLLRNKINEMFNTNTTKVSFVQDLLILLHQGTTIQTDVSNIYYQPIVLRDVVCMIGIILSTFNDSVIDTNISPIYQIVTEKLLHTSSLFINQLQQKQQQQQCNSPHSIQQYRHITLMVVFEILNILMDMYSTDDTIDSLKYNLFYNRNYTTNDNESVLQHIQRIIPIMKQQFVHYKNNNTGTNNNNDETRIEMIVDEWNEILHNLIRFVQYKKETKNM